MSRSTATLSIGIVRAAKIARKSPLPVMRSTPNVEIAWIYDRRSASALALAQAYGLRAPHLLSSEEVPACDVVLVGIPVDARGEYLGHLSSTFARRVTWHETMEIGASDPRQTALSVPKRLIR